MPDDDLSSGERPAVVVPFDEPYPDLVAPNPGDDPLGE